MNANQTKDFQSKLKIELDSVRCEFLNELKDAQHEFTGELASMLENSTPGEWIDLAVTKINPNQFPRFQRLMELEAALCQIDIGQFGYCCDCETKLDLLELSKDPAKQRCPACEEKKRKKAHN
ncbi:conjugal transfer protein TraR [Pseudoalteromonas sp. SS15]|uniref:conjugal transfer protein TraR n=1 Tax=Pseudoalteromonas sp. SS15 TaxID=3139393 RepID=UPI003BAC72F2